MRFVTLAVCLLTLSSLTVAQTQPTSAPARLLVLSKASATLNVVDPATLKVVAKIPTGEGPHEVAASPDGTMAAVSNYGGAGLPGSTLSLIDIAKGAELKRIDLLPLRRPHGIVWLADGIYFTAEFNAVVARYNPRENAIDLMAGTGAEISHMLAVDPRDGRIYTTDIAGNSVTALLPGHGPAKSVLMTRLGLSDQPEGIALSPEGRWLWAGPRMGGKIFIIDTAADSLAHTIEFDGVPIRMSFTHKGDRVLVSDAKNHRVVVFDAAARKIAGQVRTGEQPVGLVVQPDGKRAYVSCGVAHLVDVIDLEKLEVVGHVDVGPVPDGIAWAEAGAGGSVPPRQPVSLGVAIAPAPEGVAITAVGPDTAAAAAELRAGDVIVSANGKRLTAPTDLLRLLARCSPGDELNLSIAREGATIPINVTLRAAAPPQ